MHVRAYAFIYVEVDVDVDVDVGSLRQNAHAWLHKVQEAEFGHLLRNLPFRFFRHSKYVVGMDTVTVG